VGGEHVTACYLEGRVGGRFYEVVTFAAEPEGTRVTLTHRGWERCGESAQTERKGYDRGWETILRKYSDFASAYSSNKKVASA